MEYIKKEELKDGEIYKANLENSSYIVKITHNFVNCININMKIDILYKQGNFSNSEIFKFSLATSEEKHWLNSCITVDKFITFEEAMKTFIPEYVECINPKSWKQTILENNRNLIFKSDFKSTCNNQIKDAYHSNILHFKSSTKEAYDAQFIVKEEFVLPEKWYVILNSENRETLNKWRKTDSELYNDCDYECIKYDKYGTSLNHINDYLQDYQEITFEQFKKYVLKEEIIEEKVIEPLPQFKVIETIETITKVENNEGNQFFIGDKAKLSSVNYQSITGFKYNEDKTKILAILETLDVDINEIEHYIEPKVEEVKTITLPIRESLLKKAKRLYPIGTIVKSVVFNNTKTIKTNEFKEIIHKYSGKVIYADNGMTAIYSEEKDKWAIIIK